LVRDDLQGIFQSGGGETRGGLSLLVLPWLHHKTHSQRGDVEGSVQVPLSPDAAHELRLKSHTPAKKIPSAPRLVLCLLPQPAENPFLPLLPFGYTQTSFWPSRTHPAGSQRDAGIAHFLWRMNSSSRTGSGVLRPGIRGGFCAMESFSRMAVSDRTVSCDVEVVVGGFSAMREPNLWFRGGILSLAVLGVLSVAYLESGGSGEVELVQQVTRFFLLLLPPPSFPPVAAPFVTHVCDVPSRSITRLRCLPFRPFALSLTHKSFPSFYSPVEEGVAAQTLPTSLLTYLLLPTALH
jgi:hypothetical protein